MRTGASVCFRPIADVRLRCESRVAMKGQRMRGIVVAVAMGLTGPAQAADWVRTIQTGDGSTFYIDKSSISGPLEQRQVWVKFDHTTKADPAVTPESDEEAELRKRGLLAEGGNIRLVPFRPPENPVETKQLWLFRCHDGTLAISSSITYGANGKVLNSTHTKAAPKDFTPVVPDSLGESVRSWVCE